MSVLNSSETVSVIKDERGGIGEVRHVLLEPVWCPYTDEERAEQQRKKDSGEKTRAGKIAAGPNGEAPESGKWRLRFPDGTIYRGPTLSPSAIGTATDCAHAWGLERLDNNERPSKRSSDIGTEKHEELEGWLQKAQKPTTPGMTNVVAHFPMPGACESEVYFGFLFGRPGHEFVVAGWIDARREGAVHDLKTTKDMSWMKTAAQLRADLQACIYALGEMLRQGSTTATLFWTFAQHKKDGAEICRVETVEERGSEKDPKKVRGVKITKQQALTTLIQFIPTAEMMIDAIDTKKKAEDMPKDANSCSAYGGCAWKKNGMCAIPSGGGFHSIMKQERDKEKQAAERRAAKALAEAQAGTQTETTQTETETETENAEKKEKKMALGKRFASKLSSGEKSEKKPEEKKPEEKKPAPKEVKASAKVVQSQVPDTELSKADTPATANGASSGAETTNAPSGRAALLSRLKKVMPEDKGSAVEAAVTSAPKHVVGEKPVLAVGINPPDVAPEWSAEQLDAASAQIKADGEKKTKPKKKDKEAEQQVAAPVAKAALPAAPTSAASDEPMTVNEALPLLDSIAMRLLRKGLRRESALVAKLAADLAG